MTGQNSQNETNQISSALHSAKKSFGSLLNLKEVENNQSIANIQTGNQENQGPNMPVMPSQYNKLMKKLQPRDFIARPKMLTKLKIENYDRLADLDKIQIEVEDRVLTELKDQWKIMDEERLIYLIKRCMLYEILQLEERKYVRKEAKRIKELQRKAKELMLQEQMTERSGMDSPFRAGSPMKPGSNPMSPRKKRLDFEDSKSMTTMTKTNTINQSSYYDTNLQSSRASGTGGEPKITGGLIGRIAQKMGLSPDKQLQISLKNITGERSRSPSKGAADNRS